MPTQRSDAGVPQGVTFHRDTLFRAPGRGDNWCQTWAADGSVVTSMCDGDWFQTVTNTHIDLSTEGYHNHLYRILGGPTAFTRRDLPGYPIFSGDAGSWFGYGIVSVGGTIYATAFRTPRPGWSGPFRGVKLLASEDEGRTWWRVDRHGGRRR